MIVCKNCGTENADDAQFCESCQEYLGWSEKIVPQAESEPEQRLPSLASESGQLALGSEVVAAVPEVESPQAEQLQAEQLQAEQPQAIRPAPEHEPPPRKRPAPTVDPEPGELICDQCGNGNRAEANFCRKCGSSLAHATVARRPPWWRRLFEPRTYAPGERRRGSRARAKSGMSQARSVLFQVTRALAILSLVGIVSIGVWRGKAVERAGDANRWFHITFFPHYESVLPVSTRATSSLRRHGAAQAFDDVKTTFWAEGAPGDGVGQKLVARFDRLVDVSRVGIFVGDQAKPQNFSKQPVPHRLRLNFFDRRGRRIASKVLFIAQTPDFQRFSIDAPNTTKVVATILGIFHVRRGHSAAITEITLFEKH